MKINKLLENTQFTLLTRNDQSLLANEITKLYAGDLLSWVMGHVKEDGVCLLTVLSSINAVAIATLLDMSAVIFCDGVTPSKEVIDKANDEDVVLITSPLSSVEVAYIYFKTSEE